MSPIAWMIGGGVLALGGAICMLAPSTMASWPGLIGLGLIVVGVGVFVAGLFRYMNQQTGDALAGSDIDPHSQTKMTRMRLICEAMAAVAVADGRVCACEIDTFSKVHKGITGFELSEEMIREIADQADSKTFDLETHLRSAKPNLDAATCKMLLEGAMAIRSADHVHEAAENAALELIAKTLGVPIPEGVGTNTGISPKE